MAKGTVPMAALSARLKEAGRNRNRRRAPPREISQGLKGISMSRSVGHDKGGISVEQCMLL